jgi:hypothetical protein
MQPVMKDRNTWFLYWLCNCGRYLPVLEGLHLSKRLNKDAVGARAQYRGRG